MTKQEYLYGQYIIVPKIPPEIANERIRLLDKNLKQLLDINYRQRDNIRIDKVMKAIKRWKGYVMSWEDSYNHTHGGYFGKTTANTKKISDKLLDTMVLMREGGNTYREIGKAVGKTHSSVYAALQRYRPEALILDNDIPIGFKPIKEYSEYWNVPDYTVRWYIESKYLPSVKVGGKIYVDLDTEPKRPAIISFEEGEEIYRLHKMGVTASRIAEDMGRHPVTIRKLIRNYNDY